MGDEKNRAAQVTAAAAKAVSKISDPAKRAKAEAVSVAAPSQSLSTGQGFAHVLIDGKVTPADSMARRREDHGICSARPLAARPRRRPTTVTRSKPPLATSLQHRVHGNQARAFEDPQLIGECMHLHDTLAGAVGNAVGITVDAVTMPSRLTRRSRLKTALKGSFGNDCRNGCSSANASLMIRRVVP